MFISFVVCVEEEKFIISPYKYPLMPSVIIIHGTGSNPNANWFPWLKKELENMGCRVFVPQFPTPENQSLDNWTDVFKDYENHLNKDTIIIGHSLGPSFLLSVLEKRNHPVRAAFFVAGFTGLLNNPDFDTLNETFVTREFDWKKIRNSSEKFYVINSDNDPYVPLEKGEQLAENLSSELIVMENAGHINKDAGFTAFPFLLDMIKMEL